jgi:hypothetical protein
VDENPFQQDYFSQTYIGPGGLIAVLLLGTALIILPRRYAVWPMLMMACFVPPAQRVAIASLNFDLLRIMIICGTVRVLMRREWSTLQLKALDWTVIVWAGAGVVIVSANYLSLEALKYKLGVAYDALGFYFLFRCFIRDFRDVRIATLGIAIVSIPVVICFGIEHATGRNLFAFMGGVPPITMVRDGRLRCQGAFAHPILAGCFWAAAIALFLPEFRERGRRRLFFAVAAAAAIGIVVLCASSTPIGSLAVVLLGVVAFRIRSWMRVIRWGALCIIVGLHLCMEKPVWHLLARIPIVSGSTGYFRYRLIDAAVNHISEWWLHGSTLGSAHWGLGLVDTTNKYVSQGLEGGLPLLIAFVAMMVCAFRGVGILLRTYRGDREKLLIAWALGLAIFSHAVSFIGVSYFGQIWMIWFLQLAMIGSLVSVAVPRRLTRPATARPILPRRGAIAPPAFGIKQSCLPLNPPL